MSLGGDILSYIPQRPPFVMVETLESCEEHFASTSFRVRPDHIFLENGFLGEPALVENIAQTAAARIGYICQQENRPVPVGFIGAVQNLKIHELPRIGDQLQTTISIINQIFNATIIEGDIKIDGKSIASCEMRIFIADL